MNAKNHEYFMNILKTVEHHLTTITGLIAHDGNPEHSWELDETELLQKVSALIDELGRDGTPTPPLVEL